MPLGQCNQGVFVSNCELHMYGLTPFAIYEKGVSVRFHLVRWHQKDDLMRLSMDDIMCWTVINLRMEN